MMRHIHTLMTLVKQSILLNMQKIHIPFSAMSNIKCDGPRFGLQGCPGDGNGPAPTIPPPAHPGTCIGGSSCLILLTHSGVPQPGQGRWVQAEDRGRGAGGRHMIGASTWPERVGEAPPVDQAPAPALVSSHSLSSLSCSLYGSACRSLFIFVACLCILFVVL